MIPALYAILIDCDLSTGLAVPVGFLRASTIPGDLVVLLGHRELHAKTRHQGGLFGTWGVKSVDIDLPSRQEGVLELIGSVDGGKLVSGYDDLVATIFRSGNFLENPLGSGVLPDAKAFDVAIAPLVVVRVLPEVWAPGVR